MTNLSFALRMCVIVLAIASSRAALAQAPNIPGIPQPQDTIVNGNNGYTNSDYIIPANGDYGGTSQDQGQLSAIRNGSNLIVEATQVLQAGQCTRPYYLELTLVGWPGKAGSITGQMIRCTTDELLNCPNPPGTPFYELPVTGSWYAIFGQPERRSVSIKVSITYQYQYWVQPPDCRRDPGKDEKRTDDLSLFPKPPPRPAPPPFFKDPLQNLQQNLQDKLSNWWNNGVQYTYDPDYTVQYTQHKK
jgi:hypothetical protein